MKFKHIQFAQAITRRIASGEFRDGIFLPSERDLAGEYQLSRITVRKGLKLLLEQKILQTESTKGYKVLPIPDQPDKDTVNIAGLWCSGNYDAHTYALYNDAGALAAGKGYTFFLNYTGDDMYKQAGALGDLLENPLDGLLLVPTYNPKSNFMTLGNHALIRRIRSSGLPLVLLDRDFPEKDLPCVVNDEYRGGETAAEHLAKLGHRKVMLLAFDLHYYVSEQRFNGFRNKCRELGMEVVTEWIPYEKNTDRDRQWENYCSHHVLLREKIRRSGVSAILINLVRINLEVLYDLEDLELDFILYDSKEEGTSGRNVWCITRPIEEISKKALNLLLEERKTSGAGAVRQIRIPPQLLPLQKNK